MSLRLAASQARRPRQVRDVNLHIFIRLPSPL